MAFDAFLKIHDSAGNILIEGESTDKTHPGEIEIESFSWGVQNPNTAGGSGSCGRSSLQDFHFTMSTSKASPNLMLACAIGRPLPIATLTCRKAGGPSQVEFLKIKLMDFLVSSYQLGEHLTDTGFSLLGGNENLPTDQMTINFVKIDFLYTVQRTGEVVETSYDSGPLQ
jgi:type VI secretion system secreted protein Hcp